jgi:hypothetical protein
MTGDTVVALRHPWETDDPLTEILRAGARQLLAQAVEAEIAAMLAEHEHLTTDDDAWSVTATARSARS